MSFISHVFPIYPFYISYIYLEYLLYICCIYSHVYLLYIFTLLISILDRLSCSTTSAAFTHHLKRTFCVKQLSQSTAKKGSDRQLDRQTGSPKKCLGKMLEALQQKAAAKNTSKKLPKYERKERLKRLKD